MCIRDRNKYLPVQYMPLTFEFTLTHDPKSWLDTGTTQSSPTTPVTPNSTKWHLSECFLYYDIITLDAEVQQNYANVLRQGQALNLSYHSSLMQSQSVVGASFSVQLIRNLARVKSLFVTLSRNGTELEDIQAKPESTQFYHPPLVDNESNVEFNFQIGGKRLIINPIGPHDSTQMYHNLQKAIGIISMFEFLNTSPDTERRAFILSLIHI